MTSTLKAGTFTFSPSVYRRESLSEVNHLAQGTQQGGGKRGQPLCFQSHDLKPSCCPDALRPSHFQVFCQHQLSLMMTNLVDIYPLTQSLNAA